MVLSLRVVSHSEIGLVRKNNQDSGYTSPHLQLATERISMPNAAVDLPLPTPP